MPLAPLSDQPGPSSGFDPKHVTLPSDTVQALTESEASYKAALQAGNMGSWETDLRSGLRIWTEEGMALFGVDLPDGKGCVGGPNDEWVAAIHPEDRSLALELRQLAQTRDSFPAEYRIKRPSGTVVWLSGRGRVLERDDAGRPIRLVSIMADISDRKAAEMALRESEARFRSLFENAAVGMAYADLDGTWITVNQRLCDMLGFAEADLVGRSADELVEPPERGREAKELDRLLSREIAHAAFEIPYRRRDGSKVWIGQTTSLVLDRDGVPLYFVSVYRDISVQRSALERQRFLLAELAHRSKNLLAVIQGIAGQTIRSVETLSDFKTRFTQRLQGIAATQDILVRQDWTGGDLRQLVATQLELFDLSKARISVSGPDVTLSADAVQSVGLALHELATNALKYGALSAPAGQVRVRWDSQADGSLIVTWIEEGGPPVIAPSRTGFGSTVLDRMAASSVDGVVELEYAQGGLKWVLTIPGKHLTIHVD
ncbi:PAS domain S-box-containing protein [Bosea sp. BE125]|uniref:PAS domain S-box protein n=1 Tax=Bosea sp. BE125 TaxID=2817909 RepID=UPI002864A671|nr:PAS domain S-box protein [Bosea sp. BE125]MDR6873081.1 PAS domain S-box-containing protein [Bosea sp. BE125]